MDAVVIGAGVVGAACAYYAARAGVSVAVVDRGAPAGGTTGAGEGNLLVSDKEPGPELDLALLSGRLWRELADELPDRIEYEAKGGLVVAGDEAELTALRGLAEQQREAGTDAREVPADGLRDLEPHLAPGFAGAFHYPQDCQVQPALAAAHLLRAARRAGARVHLVFARPGRAPRLRVKADGRWVVRVLGPEAARPLGAEAAGTGDEVLSWAGAPGNVMVTYLGDDSADTDWGSLLAVWFAPAGAVRRKDADLLLLDSEARSHLVRLPGPGLLVVQSDGRWTVSTR